MTDKALTQGTGMQPEIQQDLGSVLFKHEMTKTMIFVAIFAVIAISMVIVNGVVNSKYEVDAFPAVILFLLMLISTIETIFIRIGHAIEGHKFYKAWLIYPITNIIVLSTIIAFLYMKFPDAFTFEDTGFFIACLMGSMVFIHSAMVVRRGEPEQFQLSLKCESFDEKKVFMSKKKMWAYRLAFGSLTFISMFLLRHLFS